MHELQCGNVCGSDRSDKLHELRFRDILDCIWSLVVLNVRGLRGGHLHRDYGIDSMLIL